MNTLLIAFEKGYASVQKLIAAGTVTVVEPRNLDDLKDIFWSLKRATSGPDVVVVDSLTKLQAKTLQESMMKLEDSESTANVFGRLVATQQDWQRMQNGISMMVSWLVDLPVRTVFICQEDERVDIADNITKKSPALNQKVLNPTYGDMDLIGRIYLSPAPFKTPDEKEYPKGTRIMRIRPTEEVMAKVRDDMFLDGKEFPPIIVEPTLAKVRKIFGHDLNAMLVYGPPGQGKTVFSCSDSMEESK